jgi:hypothetical protein
MGCGFCEERDQSAICERVGEGGGEVDEEQGRERKQDYGGKLDDSPPESSFWPVFWML